MTISAVLPLKTTGRHYADNIARTDILFSSLRAFTSPAIFDRILIIVPHNELEAAKRYSRAWSDFPLEIIDESDHFSAFQEFSHRHQIRNWHRQQIIKLYTSELVDTEYFLVFDPDCFATRAFDLETLLPTGRALTYLQPRVLEARYWKASADVLQQKPNVSGDGIWMTPAILSRTLCRSLHRRLEEIHAVPWMKVLLQRYAMDWTEYTLYWLNAEEQGLIGQFHCTPTTGLQLHTDVSIWKAGSHGENLKNWDAHKHFSAEDQGIFTVIQSNTGLDMEDVVRKLKPYMPIKLQKYDRHHSVRLKAAETYSALVRQILKRYLAFTRKS